MTLPRFRALARNLHRFDRTSEIERYLQRLLNDGFIGATGKPLYQETDHKPTPDGAKGVMEPALLQALAGSSAGREMMQGAMSNVKQADLTRQGEEIVAARAAASTVRGADLPVTMIRPE